jgi:unsaturated chondroitin disaccharide hydrolase
MPLASLLPAQAPLMRSLPQHWAVSLDARFGSPRSALSIRLGSSRVLISGGSSGWHHVEATDTRLMVDGRSSTVPAGGASTLSLRAVRGAAEVRALLITSLDDPGSVLLHRLAELHARLGVGAFPVGADLRDRLHVDSTYWTSGFLPGAFWQASTLVGAQGGSMFEQWALASTIAHLGGEQADTHDVGFMYGESSLAGWEALCRGARPPAGVVAGAVCGRLKRSVVAAADELLALAATNRPAGTIPTNSGSPHADTIIDSVMNVAILPWASKLTGNPVYARVASRHAHLVAKLLVRGDGSTAQAVNFDRATGRVLSIGTHQGLSAASTWSRGQGWAVYGYAVAASELHDRSLLRVAIRTAGYVARHLPAGGVPRWDYDAGPGAPVDVSAGVITAVGLMHLAQACQELAGVCSGPSSWTALGQRMLAAALTQAYSDPPLGFLPDQVLNEHGRGCWCNGGELIFGLTYALEGLNLERTVKR